ncbi:MAG: acyltransferase [Ignavibacteria bacterium]|jgi:acetyltransferase-like isoleucine patch superfamily enzyme|nr:acyltransferase [Ignavibacteria bacterium]MCU7519300.1 acyltransferase [Ignavibacteria bacterium]
MLIKLKPIYDYVKKNNPALGSFIHNVYYNRTIIRKVKGQRNIIHYKGSNLNKVTFDVIGNNNSITIEKKCALYGVSFYIRGDDHSIRIGQDCQFNRGSNIWLEDKACMLEIGEGSTFENVHIALTEPGSKVVIGSDCMFANDIDLRTGDSHSIIDVKSGKRINYAKDIEIGNHVWVAAHCAILKGVSIKENCVIATHSVLTKSIDEKGVIAGGNPAGILKKDITWSRERIYEKNNKSLQI